MRDESVYVAHILECIRRIEMNVAEGEEVFRSSLTVQDAVLRNLQTMCESTKRLSVEARRSISKSSGGELRPSGTCWSMSI